MNWNQAKCERCWIEDEFDEVTETMRSPTLLRSASMEVCAWCGKLTFIGLFVRQDPREVPFPTNEDGIVRFNPDKQR